jgi:Zn-dependent oligopeptidase
MDIIRKISLLKGDQLINHIKENINHSESTINKIINDNIDAKKKIKMIIEDTYIFDTYIGIINLMTLICDNNSDHRYWLMAETLLKNYNYKINTNKELLDEIVDLIKNTDNMYDKIFLSKMGRSMEKYGLNTNNPEKVSKILIQLEQTENTIFNSLEKPLKIKIDRKKIDARSDSIMSSVYPDNDNYIFVNKKKYYYLLKKLSDKIIIKDLETQYMKKYTDILPLIGKLVLLRNVYANYIGFDNYYMMQSEKTEEETEHIQNLITDLNIKLDDSFNRIVNQLKNLTSQKKQIDFNDMINIIDKITPEIKLSPIEILQYVMITIQKKFNIEFRTTNTPALNKYSNCIEVVDHTKKLKGYLHVDLLQRDSKRINQVSVIRLNNQYENNLPSVYLLGSYENLEKKSCGYSELVMLFREFGNILINIFATTPNGINEVDIEIFNFVPDIMEFIAYDDFVLELVLHKIYPNNFKKKMKEIKTVRRLELIINLKLKCANVLFDNVIHSSSSFINNIKKVELEEIKNLFINLNSKIMEDIFGKHSNVLKYNNNYINPSVINNLINGNQGLIYGTILSIILSFTAYYLIINGRSGDFINKLLENKNYSYRKMIMEFISELNNDYYDDFLRYCLNIEPVSENYYDEDMTQTDR